MADVAVIGGGPAGATAARLLASWGWSVNLIHRQPRGPSLVESLPPSARKLLAFVGLLDVVDAARFHPNAGTIAQWAGQSRTTTADTPGVHVRRADFDRELLGAAGRAGARIVDGVVRTVSTGEDARLVVTSTRGAGETMTARYVLDCSGRAGVVARRGLRRTDPPYRTLAITAEWESAGWDPAERAHTIVESYRDGWAWSVPLSDTRRQFTVMIDHDIQHRDLRDHGEFESTNPSSVGSVVSVLNVVFAREIAKALELSARLARARQISAPWACDASPYRCGRAAEDGALLVGDAASFVDPLSSAGVKKAIASAWRAAVVVNTCLATPSMTAAALEFHADREQDIYLECRRQSARFFRDARDVYGDPFWSARSVEETSVDDGRETTRVREAFDTLRREESVRLRPADSLRFALVPDIEGREVVMREAVVLPGADRPLRFAGGVNLPALVRIAPNCDGIASLVASYEAENGPAPIDGLLTGLSFLVAHRALITEGSRV